MASPAMPLIRAECTQLGLAIEASIDNGQTWVTVQLSRYRQRASQTVRQYSTCVDPAMDRAEYFERLRRRGVAFREVANG